MSTTEEQSSGLTAFERRSAISLGAVFSLRMLGLFMILPVFSLYAEHLQGVTPTLTGLAIGAYGLTQALLQIPFGMLSDRIGRKRVIIMGLLIFAAGSVVAALSGSIWGVIAGRALQGAGAIAAAVMALMADLTQEEHRARAMAIFGGSIGMSFTLALVLGPVLNGWIGVSGIFWLTGGLALSGILMTRYWVPQPLVSTFHRDAEPVPSQFKRVLTNPQLLRLDFGILVMHLLITATFVALPLVLRDVAGMPQEHHWWVYLPVLLLSVVTMLPFLVLSERRGKTKEVFLGAITLLALAEFGLAEFHADLTQIVPLLFLFFLAFNILEASLPSLVSKLAPAGSKGTALGVYSTSQFLGAFLGGGLGGWLLGAYGPMGVFTLCGAAVAAWLLVASGMRQPANLKTRMIHTVQLDAQEARRLEQNLLTVSGVAEAVVIAEERMAYLKVVESELDEKALDEFLWYLRSSHGAETAQDAEASFIA